MQGGKDAEDEDMKLIPDVQENSALFMAVVKSLMGGDAEAKNTLIKIKNRGEFGDGVGAG